MATGRVTPAANDFDDPKYRAKSAGTFKLGGKTWHIRGDVPFSLIEADPEGGGDGKVRVGPFFEAVIDPDEVDAFMALIRGPGSPLHSGNLRPLMDLVTEKISARPTTRPGSSGTGPARTAPKSSGGSSSPGGRSKRQPA